MRKKIFVNVVPWEVIIYMDNQVFPITLRPKNSFYKTTNPSDWIINNNIKEWKKLLGNIKKLNGHIADVHYYASQSGIGGPIGAAIKTCCYGLAWGLERPGGLIGHELGHNLGMPDYRGPNGWGKYKFGKPGSYYTGYQVTKMKAKMLSVQSFFNESVCEPIIMEDGRIIGRIDVDQEYDYGAMIDRNQVCRWYAGDDCEESESSKNSDAKDCEYFDCSCSNGRKKTFYQKWGYRGMECGNNKRCYDKVCSFYTRKYEWRKSYTARNAECSNAIDVGRISKERLMKDYDCIDNFNNLCLYGEKRFKEQLFPST